MSEQELIKKIHEHALTLHDSRSLDDMVNDLAAKLEELGVIHVSGRETAEKVKRELLDGDTWANVLRPPVDSGEGETWGLRELDDEALAEGVFKSDHLVSPEAKRMFLYVILIAKYMKYGEMKEGDPPTWYDRDASRAPPMPAPPMPASAEEVALRAAALANQQQKNGGKKSRRKRTKRRRTTGCKKSHRRLRKRTTLKGGKRKRRRTRRRR